MYNYVYLNYEPFLVDIVLSYNVKIWKLTDTLYVILLKGVLFH